MHERLFLKLFIGIEGMLRLPRIWKFKKMKEEDEIC
jgi:hypothetical protein